MSELSDLEITRRCAEMMGISFEIGGDPAAVWISRENGDEYNPFHDEAQAMALVKRFRLSVDRYDAECEDWIVSADGKLNLFAVDTDLNRAICLAVARMKDAK